MTDNLTAHLNQGNIESIQREIAKKTSGMPYFASNQTVLGSVTDMDSFPYGRFFRGVSFFPDPIVFEREAGYRILNDSCYDVIRPCLREEKPSNCFQPGCSVVFPCVPKHHSQYEDKGKLDTLINDACIVQYR